MKHFCCLFLYCGLTFGQNWMQISSFPGDERDDGVAVVVGSKAYVGSGLRVGWVLGADFYSYDLISHTWSPIASLPTGSERQYACAFEGGQGFYVFGGDGNAGVLNTLFNYNISANSWTQKTSKPGAGIYGASCFKFGDSIVIVGGRQQGNLINNEVWMYRISTDTWQQLHNLPSALGGRWRAAYAVLQGKGYILFGIDGNNNWRKELLEYDPRYDTWNNIPSSHTMPSLAYAGMQSIGSQLLLFAGVDSLNHYNAGFYFFELGTYTWSQGPAFNATPRRGGMCWAYNASFFYTCGLDANAQRLKDTWRLDVITSVSEAAQKLECQIWPNPFKDELFIDKCKENGSTYELWSSTGILISSDTIDTNNGLTLVTKETPPGIYILKVSGKNGGFTTKKLIKI